MNKANLQHLISLIDESDIRQKSDQLYAWLRPGQMKNTVQTMFDLINYQSALIELLEKELIDLRIEQDERKPVFFPMSYTPRKRY